MPIPDLFQTRDLVLKADALLDSRMFNVAWC